MQVPTLFARNTAPCTLQPTAVPLRTWKVTIPPPLSPEVRRVTGNPLRAVRVVMVSVGLSVVVVVVVVVVDVVVEVVVVAAGAPPPPPPPPPPPSGV
jgi:hypothetical protein